MARRHAGLHVPRSCGMARTGSHRLRLPAPWSFEARPPRLRAGGGATEAVTAAGDRPAGRWRLTLGNAAGRVFEARNVPGGALAAAVRRRAIDWPLSLSVHHR